MYGIDIYFCNNSLIYTYPPNILSLVGACISANNGTLYPYLARIIEKFQYD